MCIVRYCVGVKGTSVRWAIILVTSGYLSYWVYFFPSSPLPHSRLTVNWQSLTPSVSVCGHAAMTNRAILFSSFFCLGNFKRQLSADGGSIHLSEALTLLQLLQLVRLDEESTCSLCLADNTALFVCSCGGNG
ncbi:hypothetical protein CONLIGDRAFT_648909 [Coniochaeta ligniaria NRRL 30616]|uniref:Uncharacterized protein n=1 Tax=Coniochaeta ligniaria NRRL 30616 TaxID=1408157 RepID=A0A1J7IUJ6_9PEZI|nr:hypothetical protein CONLIGDRAFT_648909 [Coniochaeta ligniaria NRRL 30616]